MAIKRIDGKWMREEKRPDGSTYWIHMYGEEEKARQDLYFKERDEFNAEHYWNPDKDYQSTYEGLFGGIDPNRNYTPSFGAGPNENWKHALNGRLSIREGGENNRLSHFEERTSTTAKDYRSKMLDRNNAIEDMYRRGYSMDQINDHVTGQVNINTVDPDWSDYYSAQRANRGPVDAADAIRGIAPDEPAPEFWGDGYFIGGPEQPELGVNPITGSPSSPTGGGFMDGYNSTRPQAPQHSDPLMMSGNPLRSENSFLKSYMDKREALANRPSTKSLFKDMIDHE